MESLLKLPLSSLKGVGPKRENALNQLGIHTIMDLLVYFPFRYEDLAVKKISEVEDKQKLTLEGKILYEPNLQYYRGRRNRLMLQLEVEDHVVPVVFFNQPYLKKQLVVGETVQIYGTWDSLRMQLTGIRILNIQRNNDDFYHPIYPSSKEIQSNTIAKLIEQAWNVYQSAIVDILPTDLREKYQLLSFKDTIAGLHFPENMEHFKKARRTYAFMEVFIYQLRVQYLRLINFQQGRPFLYDNHQLKGFIKSLPFELTSAQKRTVNEICADLRRPKQMYRLLQGDVGSGKTVVAAIALYAVWTTGYQSALMVPTEILANQHFETLERLFSSYNIQVALLTGSTSEKQKRQILADLKTGQIDIIVGTHALIQENVEFSKLGFIIIDEQHRFGVNQRKLLREKGEHPDVLFMTATPIPRTLSITSFGEMTISSIDELPPNRKPIWTRWISSKQLNTFFKWLTPKIKEGSQIYVISLLIEESETMETETIETLSLIYNKYLGKVARIGTLHGQMNAEEKNRVMEQFKNHELDVLISTTVIEVGVNIPNAVGMIIHNADRFGLSQLHQLRGRVGRGDKESFCILIADPKTEEGKERLNIMEATNDGFILSQKDLEMRGPGDWFGKNQSGMINFKMADLIRDEAIIEIARYEAQSFFKEKDWADRLENRELIEYAQLNQMDNRLLD